MKPLLLTLVFCLAATQTMAQTQTLLNGEIRNGGYGGPELKVTQINNETGLMVGGRGGWIINNTLCIGAGGYGLTTTHEVPDAAKAVYTKNIIVNDTGVEVPRDLELELGYGGLILEYFNSSESLVHFTVDTLIGAGGVVYIENPDYDNSWEKSDAFFVLEPGVSAEMNITEWFKISAGLSYIYVNGIDNNVIIGMEDSDFGGLSGNLMFKFGSF